MSQESAPPPLEVDEFRQNGPHDAVFVDHGDQMDSAPDFEEGVVELKEERVSWQRNTNGTYEPDLCSVEAQSDSRAEMKDVSVITESEEIVFPDRSSVDYLLKRPDGDGTEASSSTTIGVTEKEKGGGRDRQEDEALASDSTGAVNLLNEGIAEGDANVQEVLQKCLKKQENQRSQLRAQFEVLLSRNKLVGELQKQLEDKDEVLRLLMIKFQEIENKLRNLESTQVTAPSELDETSLLVQNQDLATNHVDEVLPDSQSLEAKATFLADKADFLYSKESSLAAREKNVQKKFAKLQVATAELLKQKEEIAARAVTTVPDVTDTPQPVVMKTKYAQTSPTLLVSESGDSGLQKLYDSLVIKMERQKALMTNTNKSLAEKNLSLSEKNKQIETLRNELKAKNAKLGAVKNGLLAADVAVKKIEEQKSLIANMNKSLDEKNLSLSEGSKQIEKLRKELEAKNAELAAVRNGPLAADAAVKRIEEQKSLITNMNKSLASKNRLIEEQNVRVDQLEKELKKVEPEEMVKKAKHQQAVIGGLSKTLAEVKKQLEAKETQWKALTETAREKDNQLRGLTQKLKQNELTVVEQKRNIENLKKEIYDVGEELQKCKTELKKSSEGDAGDIGKREEVLRKKDKQLQGIFLNLNRREADLDSKEREITVEGERLGRVAVELERQKLELEQKAVELERRELELVGRRSGEVRGENYLGNFSAPGGTSTEGPAGPGLFSDRKSPAAAEMEDEWRRGMELELEAGNRKLRIVEAKLSMKSEQLAATSEQLRRADAKLCEGEANSRLWQQRAVVVQKMWSILHRDIGELRSLVPTKVEKKELCRSGFLRLILGCGSVFVVALPLYRRFVAAGGISHFLGEAVHTIFFSNAPEMSFTQRLLTARVPLGVLLAFGSVLLGYRLCGSGFEKLRQCRNGPTRARHITEIELSDRENELRDVLTTLVKCDLVSPTL